MASSGIDGLRVLDLAGLPGIYGTKLLADLGADVIRIEPPEGDPLRDSPPFYRDRPGPGRSLSYAFYNTSKRAMELTLQSESGRETFRKLVSTADIVFETFPPGELDALGIGYRDLEVVNPGLIWVSVTPFGSDGPRAGWKANDLVGLAAGGVLYLNGFKAVHRYRRRSPRPTTSRALPACRARSSRSSTGPGPARASSSTCRCRPRSRAQLSTPSPRTI
jgi:crotonobetainyl-CoA:carnitine CoA-transferase CaiB-like acyl-CoA transferase